MSSQVVKLNVSQADILDFSCDVILLKYAQAWHGADLSVARKLGLQTSGFGSTFIQVGDFKLISGDLRVAAQNVLFEGVPVLSQLSYAKVRQFSRSALVHLDQVLPQTKHIAMTVHGVNCGMDERESFLSQVAGIFDALTKEKILPVLETITFVEMNPARAQRLSKILDENYICRARDKQEKTLTRAVDDAGTGKEKPHVFVAMPFNPEMEDVYLFGIQGPVQEAGLLCERVDMDTFTGDIVERIKARIATAKFIIADLSGANANVYLEVGYAWGSKVKALLVCKNIDDLKFDVISQRCLIYSSINDLRKKLVDELKVLAL